MNLLSSLLARSWRNVHLAIITALSIVLISGLFGVERFVSRIIVTSLYEPFFYVKNAANDLTTAAAERDNLQLSLVEASMKLSLQEEAFRENMRLRSILGFEPPASYHIIPAKVISVSGVDLPVAAIINRGSRDSIKVDQSVINQDGLVGRVIAVTESQATVQLLTDPLNRVAARVSSSREMGIVKYRTNRGLILDNFPVQGSVVVGDTILTSGLGGVYAPGLYIGTVTTVERPEREPLCNVDLKTGTNFRSIEELFVLIAEEPWSE